MWWHYVEAAAAWPAMPRYGQGHGCSDRQDSCCCAFSSHSKTGKAKIHTSSNKEARAVERPLFEGRDNGKFGLQPQRFAYLVN